MMSKSERELRRVNLFFEKVDEKGVFIYVKVRIGSQKLWGLIDTGASRSMISDSISDKLKIPITYLQENDKKVSGVSGSVDAVGLQNITQWYVGKHKMSKLTVGVMQFDYLHDTCKEHKIKIFDMIIGADFLKERQVILDFKNKSMNL